MHHGLQKQSPAGVDVKTKQLYTLFTTEQIMNSYKMKNVIELCFLSY